MITSKLNQQAQAAQTYDEFAQDGQHLNAAWSHLSAAFYELINVSETARLHGLDIHPAINKVLETESALNDASRVNWDLRYAALDAIKNSISEG